MEPNAMKDRILEKIRQQRVLMRSRGSYLLGVAALVVVSLAVLSITIFSFNFIFFSLQDLYYRPTN